LGREQRRLAAIVSADVAGYSRLMGRDESGTVARLRQNRTERLEPVLAHYGGRLVKLTGDGALIEFASAVDALGAAIAFQQGMAEVNQGQPDDNALKFRVGLHLGDLIVDGDDLYGDGVNVAARLEAEAPAGSIVVSGTARDFIGERVKARFVDLGELSLKNIERPVRAWRIEWDAVDWPAIAAPTPEPAKAHETASPALALPDKPSIAVLPFQNMSGDPEQEYFADGIVEDIITALSRFKSLFVIARNSSFTYKGKAVDIKQVGRELGVRYVLEGSVRKAGGRVRVTGQLIDAATGSHVWAERLDRELADIFAVQDEIMHAIVAAIAPQIEITEQARALRHPKNPTVYDRALRARHLAFEGNAKSNATLLKAAIDEAQHVLAADPDSVIALTALAYANGTSVNLRFADDREKAIATVLWAATRIIELDESNALGYALRAAGWFFGGKYDRHQDALHDARRAHELNPNDTFVLLVLAYGEAGTGNPLRAIDYGHEILRLNPRQPRAYDVYNLLSFACLAAKQYAEGIDWAGNVLRDMPTYVPARLHMTVHLVGMDRIEEAKASFEIAQKLAPAAVAAILEDKSVLGMAEDRRRFRLLLQIAAGLEDPSAAEAFG
jgi:adenylate cyclase